MEYRVQEAIQAYLESLRAHDEPIPPSINEGVVEVAGAITFGMLKGSVEVSNDFDDQLPDDVLAAFEGPSRTDSPDAPNGP